MSTTWQFPCLATPVTPTGALWKEGPLEWAHLPA